MSAELFLEDLQHRFAVSLVHLRQGLLNQRPILEAAGVEHFVEAKCRMPKEDLRVLEALVVICYREVNFVRKQLNLLEHIVCLFNVSRGVLAHTELRHLVNEFGIKEALLARLCLRNSGLQISDALLVGWFFVWGVGKRLQCKEGGNDEDR